MNDYSRQLETVLFIGAQPFSIKKLGDLLELSANDIESAIADLEERLRESALMVQRLENEVQLVTRPEFSEVAKKVAKNEAQGELTRAALEALTILAYRGPLTRPELEQIRGVQSSMILRNLMLRGLVEEKEDTRLGQSLYQVTFDFVRHLGLSSLEELPQYEALRGHENVMDVLKDMDEEEKNASATEGGASEDRQKMNEGKGIDELTV